MGSTRQLQQEVCARNQEYFLIFSAIFSDEWGLHLVIDKVKENSPAWKGGLRTFDCIVSVHGWVITLFDKAEVSS